MTLARVTLSCMAATLIGHAAWAAQGVVIVEKTTVNGAPETHQIQITPQRMRADVAGPNGLTTIVFDATKQVLSLINTDRMTYSEMTKAEADDCVFKLLEKRAFIGSSDTIATIRFCRPCLEDVKSLPEPPSYQGYIEECNEV